MAVQYPDNTPSFINRLVLLLTEVQKRQGEGFLRSETGSAKFHEQNIYLFIFDK